MGTPRMPSFECPECGRSTLPKHWKWKVARRAGAAVAQGGAAEHRPSKPEVAGNQSSQPSPTRSSQPTGREGVQE